eukprot:g3436.t1
MLRLYPETTTNHGRQSDRSSYPTTNGRRSASNSITSATPHPSTNQRSGHEEIPSYRGRSETVNKGALIVVILPIWSPEKDQSGHSSNCRTSAPPKPETRCEGELRTTFHKGGMVENTGGRKGIIIFSGPAGDRTKAGKRKNGREERENRGITCLDEKGVSTLLPIAPQTSSSLFVLVGIIKAEAHLKSYLSQLTTQTAFQQAEFLFLTVREGGKGSEWCLDFVKAHANAALVRFNQDPGLYSMWNFGARVMGRGEAITNWNADDRKHPDSLRLHWNALGDNPSVMVVGSAVLVTYTPNLSWEQAAASKDTQTWWTDYGGGSPVLIGLQDLYLYNRFGAPRAPNNIMHNSPMWRKKLHDHIGYINEARYSSGADFAFWLSAARSLPGSLLFLPTPLELYYIHPNTYGREHEKDNPEAKNRLFSDFVPFIRYKRLRVLVTHEKFPSNKSGGDIRILGLLRWLVLRGYDVTLVSRGDMWQACFIVCGWTKNVPVNILS